MKPDATEQKPDTCCPDCGRPKAEAITSMAPNTCRVFLPWNDPHVWESAIRDCAAHAATVKQSPERRAIACPWCKSTDRYSVGTLKNGFRAACRKCGAMGPNAPTHEAAIEAWNTRAEPNHFVDANKMVVQPTPAPSEVSQDEVEEFIADNLDWEDDGRPTLSTTAVRAFLTGKRLPAAAVTLAPGCHRSHPHESMSAECEAKTAVARANHAVASAPPAAAVAEPSREDFETWYRHKVDSNADFQIGREYEDDRVYSGWAAWREQHQRLTSPPAPTIPDSDAKIQQLTETVERLTLENEGLAMIAATPPAPAASAQEKQTQAARDVLVERRRQIEKEGWDDAHDASNELGSMALAAASYAAAAATGIAQHSPDDVYARNALTLLRWPWARRWWKPKTPRRDLVRAAALILAEIELLDRRSPATTKHPSDNEESSDE